MKPAPNPHAAEQRASIAAHMAQARGIPATAPEESAPPAGLLDRVFEHWPDMAKYRETARIERIDYWTAATGWQWQWCVTITA